MKFISENDLPLPSVSLDELFPLKNQQICEEANQYRVWLDSDSFFYVDTRDKFNQFIQTVRFHFVCSFFIFVMFQEFAFVGFDCEWMGNFYSMCTEDDALSLIQVANGKECFLIDCIVLAKEEPLHNFLQEINEKILINENIVKAGFSLKSDCGIINASIRRSRKLAGINEDYVVGPMVNVFEFLDFQKLIASNEKYSNLFRQIKLGSGANDLVFSLMNYKLDKQEQASYWRLRPLRLTQLHYAALDAISMVECYCKIQEVLGESFDSFVIDLNGSPSSKSRFFSYINSNF